MITDIYILSHDITCYQFKKIKYMAGIYGALVKNNQVTNGYSYFVHSTDDNFQNNEVTLDGNMILGRSVLNKFNGDRFFYEDDDAICCFEGINYSDIKTPQRIIRQLKKNKNHFLKELRGVFTGFMFDKRNKTVTVFNDQFSTKNVYYHYSKEHGLLFASRLHVLTTMMKQNSIPMEYNLDGIYSLALFGQLFFESTMIKDVFKLDYGSSITFDTISGDQPHIEKYYTFKKEEREISFDKALADFEELMRISVKREWQKDKDYGLKHFSLLSSGMDSRINFMLANKLGFDNITTFCYGNPNSEDMNISSEIAQDLSSSHITHQITNGNYQVENIIQNYLKLSDGMVLYTPSATMRFSIDKINYRNFGTQHSGQIGDTIGGSFIKENFDFQKNIGSIGWNGFVRETELLRKVLSIDKIIQRYKNTDYEIYAYEQRAINCDVTGDRVASHFTDQVSPFFDVTLNELTLSLPNHYRLNQKFYFSWLKKYHPEILNYRWQKVGVKPTSLSKIKYGALYKKYFNGFKKYFNLKYDSMNPIGNWIKQDPTILERMDSIFHQEIKEVGNSELAEDLGKIYRNDICEVRHRVTVIGILLSLKIHVD